MTISRTIRKRLRRYALFCLMAATTAGMVETAQISNAGDTHDSGELCGWIEELSETTFSKEATDKRKQTPKILAPQFLAVNVDEELSIDTCSYDAWLAGTLAASNAAKVDATDKDVKTDVAAETKTVAETVAETQVAADIQPVEGRNERRRR